MGLSGLKLALVAAVIWTSASRQISCTLPRRSSSERKPLLYSLAELVDHRLVRAEDLGLLLGGDDDVVLGHGDGGAGREVEADLLEHVEDAGDLVGAVEGDQLVDEGGQTLLGHRVVDVGVVALVAVAEDLAQALFDAHVEQAATDGRDHTLAGRADGAGSGGA